MRIKKSILFTIVLGIAMIGASAFAELVVVETSTKTEGATTVAWDSSFHDMNYTLGDTITMTVTWTVLFGAAEYAGCDFKRFTPKSKKDPATGTVPSVTKTPEANEVVVEFAFTGLHYDARRNVEIGNAHFKLKLWVDEDGDGVVDEVEGYGVNVHVEDPQ